ncbi:MAG: hypothetical protein FJZ49_00125 [Candidatus Verstraetearchaeota archaeon]|nr:hypothetical protein [Candidatus Verstraetearchaeota archaeon]
MGRGISWSPSYYVGTVGHISAETVQRYIQEQGRHSSTEFIRWSFATSLYKCRLIL